MRSGYNLTEREIRWAISNSNSNQEASMMLHVSLKTFRDYAKKYYDIETGGTLFDILKHKRLRGSRRSDPEKLVEEILAGKKPWMPRKKVERILIQNCIFVEQCVYCGESEKRITDNKSVCALVWKDGNYSNHSLDNLEMVCYNHFFLYYGDLKFYGHYTNHNKKILKR